MKKVKLVIGTVNNSSLLIGEKNLEEVYERSYKPFLRKIHKHNLPVTLYYSGGLLSWLIDKHDGVQMLFNDLIRQKRIEILGGGYYSPLFSLIPRKDRVGQIEMMTTDIRRRFGRRPRGMWITEKVWEPSMPMTMNNAGMEFTFLDEEFFEDAGLFNGELCQPCVTEDQGKKVTIFPVSNRLVSQFLLLSPNQFIDQILECGSEREDRVVSLLLSGEELNFSEGAEEKLEGLFNLIYEKNKRIEVILPSKYIRETGQKRKVYFGCVSPGDIGRWSGPVFREKIEPDNSEGGESRIKAARERAINTQSFFRHFLAKYPESNNLYSRMIDVHQLVSQLRGDRQRKRAAEIELYKSQNHSAYWYGGGEPGIYSAEARRKAYASLIEAEKFTRERSGFRAALIKYDFDMDGLDEIIYRGLSINANIHLKGGSVFELDYFRTPHNYVATMARHREWYHDEDITDLYTRNAFIDHFFQPDEKFEKFFDMNYRENGDFVTGIYDIDNYSKDKKEFLLTRNGNITTKKNKFSVRVSKTYSFKRNSVIIDYEIVNTSDYVLTTAFGSEMNFAFSSSKGVAIEIELGQKDNIKKVENKFSENNIHEMLIKDKKRNANVVFETDLNCTLWGCPIYTNTGTGKVVEKLYQANCFVPLWTISLGPGKIWKNRIQLRIDRKSKKSVS